MKVKNLKEAYESANIDQPSFVDDEVERLYGPIRKMINNGEYEAAEKELDDLTADLDEFEAQNNKKRFFKYPQFIIDGQRKNIEALRAKLPAKVAVGESIEDMDKRCEKCNTLLNDGGTCPKCDDGEEDYGDERLQLDESIFEDIKLILDESVSKSTCPELASRIARLAKNEMSLSDYDTETLEHDINNLRAHEWVDQFNELPETSVAKNLFFAHVIEDDDKAVKEIIHGIVEDMFEIGHPDPEAWADVLLELEGFDFDETAAHDYFIHCLNAGPEGILTEALLMEGPMGPALRKFGRSIANKFAPKGAEEREIKGHEKDDKAQHKKHAHPVLARDFTTKAQKWRFIANKKKIFIQNIL